MIKVIRHLKSRVFGYFGRFDENIHVQTSLSRGDYQDGEGTMHRHPKRPSLASHRWKPVDVEDELQTMGNVCHAGPVLGGDVSRRDASPPASPVKRALTFGRDPTLKREDYIFSRVAGPSVLVKAPGSVSGQQFLVEECRDCDVFVLDHCTAVQIDECTNCRIVIGPCTGSLFLRNCSGCTLVCAVQQFRARDCKECDVFLYCATGASRCSLLGLHDRWIVTLLVENRAHHRVLDADAVLLIPLDVLFAAAAVRCGQVLSLEQQVERGMNSQMGFVLNDPTEH